MTTFTGRMPTSYTETLYDADIPYDSDIRYDWLIITNTTWTGRLSISTSNTIEVIINWIWDDTKSWDDVLYWNDTGNRNGTIFTGRTIPA